MPPKLAIAIVIISVLMVAFGNNPVEEARIENQKKYKGEKDPLMRAIIDYNEEKSFGKNKSGNGRPDSNVVTREPVKYPDHMIPHENRRASPYVSGRKAREMDGQMPGDSGLNNNSYYPPPPVRDDSGGRMGAPTQPRSDGHMFLRGGERLAYSGTNVYYLDKEGNRKRLPDGRYRTANGLELFVVGGQKTIASN